MKNVKSLNITSSQRIQTSHLPSGGTAEILVLSYQHRQQLDISRSPAGDCPSGDNYPHQQSGLLKFPWEKSPFVSFENDREVSVQCGPADYIPVFADQGESYPWDDDEEETVRISLKESIVGKINRCSVDDAPYSPLLDDEEVTIAQVDNQIAAEYPGDDRLCRAETSGNGEVPNIALLENDESDCCYLRDLELVEEGSAEDDEEFEKTLILSKADDLGQISSGKRSLSFPRVHSVDEEDVFAYLSTQSAEKELFPEKDESYLKVYLKQIMSYLQHERYEEALQLILATLQRQPTGPDVLHKLAYLENYSREKILQQQLSPKKEKRLQTQEGKVLQINAPFEPTLPRIVEMRSNLVSADRNTLPVKTAPRRSLSPEKMTYHRKKGVVYWQAGETDKAIQEFSIASNSEKHALFCHTMLGVCYAEKNRVVDAISHFKQGLHSENISSREEIALYFKLGRSYEHLRNKREALYYYNKVARHCPNYRGVQQRIELIKRQEIHELDS